MITITLASQIMLNGSTSMPRKKMSKGGEYRCEYF